MLNPNWCVEGSSLGRCRIFLAEPGPVLGKEPLSDPKGSDGEYVKEAVPGGFFLNQQEAG